MCIQISTIASFFYNLFRNFDDINNLYVLECKLLIYLSHIWQSWDSASKAQTTVATLTAIGHREATVKPNKSLRCYPRHGRLTNTQFKF